MKTLDQLLAMSSIAQKIINLKSKEGYDRADESATADAAAASNPSNSDQLQEEEDRAKGEAQEGGGEPT